jgi:hypothetical protein
VKTYWDTSAIINAAISPDVYDRLNQGKHVTRLHSLAEFFATITGRGVEIKDPFGGKDRLVLTPQECAEWLSVFAQRAKQQFFCKSDFTVSCGPRF